VTVNAPLVRASLIGITRTSQFGNMFSENSAKRTTAREEGKRQTDENAVELVIEDNKRKYGLHLGLRS